MSESENRFIELEEKIKIAELQGQPIDDYIIEQIDILKRSLDGFISQALSQGYRRDDIRVGEIEVKQYRIMEKLANKINLPIDEYEKHIKEAQIRVLGEDVYNAHINNN